MQKVVNDLAPHHWPAMVALSYSRKLSDSAQIKLLKSKSYKALISRPGASQAMDEILRVAQLFSFEDLKDAEKILERSLSSEVRKADGAVYTPDYIIQTIIEQSLVSKTKKSLKVSTVLDPACGSGGFLIGALRFIHSKTGESYNQISSRLFGLDINPDAVENALLLLDLACLEQCDELSDSQILTCDTLTTSVSEQLSLIGQSEGVTALVTNPPYVKLQTLTPEYRLELIEKFPEYASGSFSLATFFLAQALSYLEPNGVAGFITMNNLFTSLSGQPLREEWNKSHAVKKIIDFRHFTVFEASAYTCLVFISQKSEDSFDYAAINEAPNEISIRNLAFSKVFYKDLNPKKWRLVSSENSKIVLALEGEGKKLRHAAEIKVGLATLFDKAYLCQKIDGAFIAIGGDGKEREIEPGIVQLFTKISELSSRVSVEKVQRGIIYPYNKTLDSRPLMSWKEISRDYPNAAEHLNTWKERLLARSGVKPEMWFEWGRRQSLIAGGPKLLTKTFDKVPSFHLDMGDGLFANGYSVRPLAGDSNYSIHQLKAFLESRFMFAYALMTSFEIGGGYQCYQKNFIENICLPEKNLIPDKKGATIPKNSEIEQSICEFYGFSISDLESCLSGYLSDSSVEI